jgi:carbonic anhydrase/acetyltransferase-like protein (isoleucine patch superfamily)
MKVIRSARGLKPEIANDVFIAENAAIIGDVHIQEKSSVWYNVTLRGDVMPIRIGKESNIQDNSVLHGTYQEYGCTIGDRVTVGHGVILHGCTIENSCLIGMGTIIMDNVVIGAHSIVGAGSLVTEGKKFPPRSLILGRPAVVKRALTESEIQSLEESADHYLLYKTWY